MECAMCGDHSPKDEMSRLVLSSYQIDDTELWEYICARCNRLIVKLFN